MSAINLVYLYLLSPLHTGSTTQEGNLLGIARESHTNLPYVPSSTIRGRLRASEKVRFGLVMAPFCGCPYLRLVMVWYG